MTTAKKRWRKDARKWLEEKRARKRWLGRPGHDALVYLLRCADHIARGPKEIEEPDLWVLVEKTMGPRPLSKHYGLSVLSSFLEWCGNPVVRTCGIRARFSRRPGNRPIAPSADMARVQRMAEPGEEQAAEALRRAGRRRIEIARAKLEDFHLEDDPPSMDVRGKGGRSEVTGEPVALPDFVLDSLAQYVRQRRAEAAGPVPDSGHLIWREDGWARVGVSTQYVDRLHRGACARAGKLPSGATYWPGHAFRRGAATTLAERGAHAEDIAGALQNTVEVAKQYVDGLLRRRRVHRALALLEEPQDSAHEPEAA